MWIGGGGNRLTLGGGGNGLTLIGTGVGRGRGELAK